MDKWFTKSALIALATKNNHLVVKMAVSHAKVVTTTATYSILWDETRLGYRNPSFMI